MRIFVHMRQRARLAIFVMAMFIVIGAFAPTATMAQCLPIDTVTVTDVHQFEADEVATWVAPFEGECLGFGEFDQILERITLAYVDKGYILSRAYLPEQDLSDRELTIAVVEGRVSQIRVNGEPAQTGAQLVFPNVVGNPANIRQVEQGLDQIEEMPRWSASMEFEPDEQPGESVLSVTAQTEKPFEWRLTTNNQGSEQSGEWLSGIAADWSNILNLNETWTFNLTKSLGANPVNLSYDGDTTRSGSFEFSLPYGYWDFTYKRSWSTYRFTIDGAISTIETTGDSNTDSLEARRLLYRDQDSKTYGSLLLSHADSRNYILGALIEASSRDLTSLKGTLSHERPMWGGTFKGTLHADAGLRIFGAEDARTMPEGSPDAQYFLWGFSADFQRPLPVRSGQLNWTSTLSGQVSSDRLYGGQQFSIGGVSTVRGTKSSLAVGSTGVLWRNELSYGFANTPQYLGNTTAYIGVDAGRIIGREAIDTDYAGAVGSVIGLKFSGDHHDFDVSYQEILGTSSGIDRPSGELLVSMSFKF